MPLNFGAATSKAHWLNDTTWCCERHMPSAKIPARLDTCWYAGCPSCRPPVPEPVVPVEPPVEEPVEILIFDKPLAEAAPAAPRPRRVRPPRRRTKQSVPAPNKNASKEEQDWDLILRHLKDYQGPTAAGPSAPPAPLDQVEPSAAERKRGATQQVQCQYCGVTMWRRPKDVIVGKVFFCQAHRNQKAG